MEPKNVSIIVPVHNESESLKSFAKELSDFAKTHGFELVFVDDGCTDNSRAILEKLSLNCVSHSTRQGYGAALKTGVKHATRPYVLFADGDGEHRLEDILRISRSGKDNSMVIGARKNPYRATLFIKFMRSVLTGLVNNLTGAKIKDINSGLRLVQKDFFCRYASALPDTFSCTTTLSILAAKLRQDMVYIPIEVRMRKGKSKVNLFKDGLNSIILILRTITLLNPLAIFLPISLIFILVSIIYGLYVALTRGFGIPVLALMLFVCGIILFALGLICDQISSLRLELLKKD